MIAEVGLRRRMYFPTKFAMTYTIVEVIEVLTNSVIVKYVDTDEHPFVMTMEQWEKLSYD